MNKLLIDSLQSISKKNTEKIIELNDSRVNTEELTTLSDEEKSATIDGFYAEIEKLNKINKAIKADIEYANELEEEIRSLLEKGKKGDNDSYALAKRQCMRYKSFRERCISSYNIDPKLVEEEEKAIDEDFKIISEKADKVIAEKAAKKTAEATTEETAEAEEVDIIDLDAPKTEEVKEEAKENSTDSERVEVEKKTSTVKVVGTVVGLVAVVGGTAIIAKSCDSKDTTPAVTNEEVNKNINDNNNEQNVTPEANDVAKRDKEEEKEEEKTEEEVTTTPEVVDPNRFDDINNEEQVNNRIEMLINKYYVGEYSPKTIEEKEALRDTIRETLYIFNEGYVEDTSFTGIVKTRSSIICDLQSKYFKGEIKDFSEADFIADGTLGKEALERDVKLRNRLVELNRQEVAGQLEFDKEYNDGLINADDELDINQAAKDVTNLDKKIKLAAVDYLANVFKMVVGEGVESIGKGTFGVQALRVTLASGSNGGMRFPEEIKDDNEFKEFYINNADGTSTLVNINKALDLFVAEKCTDTVSVNTGIIGEDGKEIIADMPATIQNNILVNLQKRLDEIKKMRIRNNALRYVDQAINNIAMEDEEFEREYSFTRTYKRI